LASSTQTRKPATERTVLQYILSVKTPGSDSGRGLEFD
jgi:hypothetical protein